MRIKKLTSKVEDFRLLLNMGSSDKPYAKLIRYSSLVARYILPQKCYGISLPVNENLVISHKIKPELAKLVQAHICDFNQSTEQSVYKLLTAINSQVRWLVSGNLPNTNGTELPELNLGSESTNEQTKYLRIGSQVMQAITKSYFPSNRKIEGKKSTTKESDQVKAVKIFFELLQTHYLSSYQDEVVFENVDALF